MPEPASPRYEVKYLEAAVRDLEGLDGAQRKLVRKAIEKVRKNPLPQTEGGYGKPLHGNLSGLLKIKLRDAGLRVVYRLDRQEDGRVMLVIVIAARANDDVYEIASERTKR